NGEEVEAIRKQTFRLNEDHTECDEEEKIFEAESLDQLETITEESPMGLDFIRVVEIPVDELLGGEIGDGEILHLREQNDILNQMNEDAIESLTFEMFSMTALINAAEGTANKMRVAPGSVIEMRNAMDG